MDVVRCHGVAKRVVLTCLVVIVGICIGFGGVSAYAVQAAYEVFDARQYWLNEPYGVEKSWEFSRGAGIKIAIIDSGVDGNHPDLKDVVVDGKDFSGVGAPDGQRPIGPRLTSHGTWVASLAAARPHEAGGMIGSAPEAEIMSASLWIGGKNPGGVSFEKQITDAIFWAVDHGASIINMSLGRDRMNWPQSWDAAFKYAEQKDVLIIAAAGNRESGKDFVGAPATIPGVLTVGGLDAQGKASVASSVQGVSIGVMAPSENLLGASPGGGLDIWDGTSGAAPIVAGIAANIRSKYPEMKVPEVINRIISTTKPVEGRGTKASVDPIYGRGVIDAYAALNVEIPPVSQNPLGTITEWIRVNRRAEVTGQSLDEADPLTSEQLVAEPSAPVAQPPWEKTFPLAVWVTAGGILVIVGMLAFGLVHVIARVRAVSSVPVDWSDRSGNSFLGSVYEEDVLDASYLHRE